ncbi:hypothetical protein MRX96_049177 [Rhipicephalus microplus]
MSASSSESEAPSSSEHSMPPVFPATLRGFRCDFLEMREVAFVEPVDRSNMCVCCKNIPGSARRLTCSHIVCDDCHDDAVLEPEEKTLGYGSKAAYSVPAMCPVDYTPFDEAHFHVEPVNLYRLQERLVFCPYVEFGCQFINKLKYLRHHYYNDCYFSPFSSLRGSTEIPEFATLPDTLGWGGTRF